MRQTLRLGRVAGIPVGVNWSVLVIMGLVAVILGQLVLPGSAPGSPAAIHWIVAVPTAAVFLASLLAHELAHALVAVHYGIRVRSITLWMLGGVAHLEDEPSTPRIDFRIAAVGPLTSLVAGVAFLLAGGASFLLGGPAVISAALGWIGLLNTLIAVFNLLPGAPLDGGRILRSVLWRMRGSRAEADRAAARTGVVLGSVLIGLGFASVLVMQRIDGIWLMLVGWFLARAAGAEQQASTVRTAVTGVPVRDAMTSYPDVAPAWSSVSAFVRQAARSRQAVFPVVDFAGEPRSVVTLALLAALPPQQADARIDSVAVTLPREYIAGPDDQLIEVLQRRPLAGAVLAVVVEGHVVGMVTTDDVHRMVQLRRLQSFDVQPGTAAPP